MAASSAIDELTNDAPAIPVPAAGHESGEGAGGATGAEGAGENPGGTLGTPLGEGEGSREPPGVSSP